MSTVAIRKNSYVENSTNKISLKERLARYFEENGAMIASGLMMMNGKFDYSLYRSLTK